VDIDAKLLGAPGQNFEQPLAPDADETMARRADAVPLDMDLDIVPMGELVGDDPPGDRVVGHQILDRLIRKDHAPAEGHAFRVALEHMHLVPRIAELHRNGEVEACRAAADACDSQALLSQLQPMLAGLGDRCISHHIMEG
jgi:hypothetical protein